MTGPGRIVSYPTCGDWTCDDDYDWEVISQQASPEAYRAIKREEQIVLYHQPRNDWLRRLREERDTRNGGDPLWSGKW